MLHSHSFALTMETSLIIQLDSIRFDIIGMLFRSSPSRDSVKDVDREVNIGRSPHNITLTLLPIVCDFQHQNGEVSRQSPWKVARKGQIPCEIARQSS